MEVIKMPTIPNVEVPYPELGMKDPFAKQPGMRYGNLSIEKNVIRVNDGTSTTVQIDADGFHGYNHASQELVRINYLGLHGYNTSGDELVLVDATGLHAYDSSANEIVTVNDNGLTIANTSGTTLVLLDADGLHAYDGSENEIATLDQSGLEISDTGGTALVLLDATGLHAYDGSSNEIVSLGTSGLQVADTSGNVLVVLDADGFLIQNTSGVKLLQSDATGFETFRDDTGSPVSVAKMEDDGIILRNTRGLFFEETTENQYGAISANASNQLIVDLPSTNQFFMVNYAGDTNLFTASADDVYSESTFMLHEITEPDAPGANFARIYCKDSGGKTQLCVRFNTGAVQVIATEP